MLRDWIQNRKDDSVSLIAEKVLQKYVEPYGRLAGLDLNSRNRSASVKVLLKGETEPLVVQVQEYQVLQEAAGSFVTIKRVDASREWVALLLRDFVVGRRFEIPPQYAGYVRLVL